MEKIKPHSKVNSVVADNCQKRKMIDNCADAQVLPRKVLNVDETVQKFMNKSLSAQLANGLRDPNHAIFARAKFY